MRNRWIYISLLLGVLVFCSNPLLAQTMPEAKTVEMADGLRSSGKIYVVVAVLITILLGLFLYLATLDRKIRTWEKDN